jgi:nickel-dependent lactate racemase
MRINLAYGQGHLAVDSPEERTTVIQPSYRPGLADERTALVNVLENPIGSASLRRLVQKAKTICILFTDITRATPNHRIIPWLLDFLKSCGVTPDRITLLNQLGTHRPNTREELERMLTKSVVETYCVLNHEPENAAVLVQVGTTCKGIPALLNRHAVEADLRIVTGFIEPHFFAGFSGGVKGLMPGVAGLQTIMSNHGFDHISDPNATFGVTFGNPLWEELRDIALRAGPSFVLNVALNDSHQITNVFAGDLIEAHRVGCEFVRGSAMQRISEPFDIVVTSNSGYPLDQNLYQGVKGMAAGARILKTGGTLILACECRGGVPTGSSFDRLLQEARTPEEILTLLAAPGLVRPEQWQVQVQSLIQRKATVLVYSSLTDEMIRAAHLTPCHDIRGTIAHFLARLGPETRVAVLPQGPLTIPYIG